MKPRRQREYEGGAGGVVVTLLAVGAGGAGGGGAALGVLGRDKLGGWLVGHSCRQPRRLHAEAAVFEARKDLPVPRHFLLELWPRDNERHRQREAEAEADRDSERPTERRRDGEKDLTAGVQMQAHRGTWRRRHERQSINTTSLSGGGGGRMRAARTAQTVPRRSRRARPQCRRCPVPHRA